MKKYDVIIVGAGPAGLMCAETLSQSSMSVLLLEKKELFGDKICAGGLTRKDMALLDVPEEIIEHRIRRTALYAGKRKSSTNAGEPFVFTVNRVEFGTWQKSRLHNTGVEIRNNAKVTQVDDTKIVVNGEEAIGYRYLVGADGYFSAVRKYLGLPQEKRLIGIQYRVPDPQVEPQLEIYLNSKYFYSWYAWKFPHDKSFVIGCAADPRKVPSHQLKANFKKWLTENGVDVSQAKYESYPISYDYRGYRFNDKYFLAGEAAGMASGLTGEGIYQSLVSGLTVAKTILDGNYQSSQMEAVLKYNAVQERILNILWKAGPLRGPIFNLIVALMNNKRVKAKINNSFS